MLRALKGRRTSGDDGAVAILTALILLFVLIPAAALGMSTYTRVGVLDEQSRAADAGALAGAASLTLANVSTTTIPVVNVISPPDAYANAVAECTNALTSANNPLSKAFTAPLPGGVPACTASPASNTKLLSCVNSLLTPPAALTTLPPIVLPTVTGVFTQVQTTVAGLLQSLLPGLINNGVTVRVDYLVGGPIDKVFGSSVGKTQASTTSTARRRFKAILPDLTALPQVNGAPPQLTGVLSPAQGLLVNTLQVTLQELQTIVGDLPTVNPISLHDLLVAYLAPLGLPITVPPIPATPVVAVPAGGLLPASCIPALKEVIADLQDALQPDPGNGSVNALNCVQTILGLPSPSLPPAPVIPTGAPLGQGLRGAPIGPPLPTLAPLPTLPAVPVTTPTLPTTINPNCANQLFRSELTQ